MHVGVWVSLVMDSHACLCMVMYVCVSSCKVVYGHSIIMSDVWLSMVMFDFFWSCIVHCRECVENMDYWEIRECRENKLGLSSARLSKA